MRNIIILLLLLFVNFRFSQRCHGDNPIYHTKAIVYLYQEMNSNSAIVKEIPKGEAVRVVSSFFGSTGFWQVCRKGKTAYALKSQLSFDEISSSENRTTVPSYSSNKDYTEREVGIYCTLIVKNYSILDVNSS